MLEILEQTQLIYIDRDWILSCTDWERWMKPDCKKNWGNSPREIEVVIICCIHLSKPAEYKIQSCFSVTMSCRTLCDPTNCSTPGFPVLHYRPEFAQTHVLLKGWCHSTFFSSVSPFSSCPRSFPASGSFPMSAAIYPSIIHHAQHHLPMRTLGTYWISCLTQVMSSPFLPDSSLSTEVACCSLADRTRRPRKTYEYSAKYQ